MYTKLQDHLAPRFIDRYKKLKNQDDKLRIVYLNFRYEKRSKKKCEIENIYLLIYTLKTNCIVNLKLVCLLEVP